MNTQLLITLIIFGLMVVGFVQNKVSRSVVALGAMAALVLTKCLSPSDALKGFSNSNTVLMASMFVVSEGFSRTRAVKAIASLVGRVSKGSLTKVMLGYVFITMLLAQVAGSSSAAFAIMFPMVFAVCDEMGVSPSKMLFPIGMISITTIATVPIGGSAVTYAQNNGYLEAYGVTEYSFKMFDQCIARLPAVILVCLYAAVIAPRFCPDYPRISADSDGGKGKKERPPLGKVQETAGWITFALVILGMLFADTLGIPAWLFTLIGALSMAVFGILKSKEVYAAATMNGIVTMYIGVLGVGNALTATGAGELVGDAVASVLGNIHNQYLLGFCFFLIPFLLTQIMNNRAVNDIFIPIAIMTCISLGCNPLGPILLTMDGALTSMMTPMATATVNMYMGLGGYSQKDLLKMGLIPALIIGIVNVVWTIMIFPLY
ncbi:MAG: hypothetical protein ENTB_01879 [Enterocloster aldenensis]